MTKKEIAYFSAAAAVAELSDHPHYKLGAVIVHKHRIVSSGYNSLTRCHPIQAKLDTEKYGEPCPGKRHAESDAIIPLLKNECNYSGAVIYVARILKNGHTAMARPCSSCEKLIRQLGIKKMYYTIPDGYAVERIN